MNKIKFNNPFMDSNGNMQSTNGQSTDNLTSYLPDPHGLMDSFILPNKPLLNASALTYPTTNWFDTSKLYTFEDYSAHHHHHHQTLHKGNPNSKRH